jgi:GPH family glycoside/pentoside/hexuronide:cation symporter
VALMGAVFGVTSALPLLGTFLGTRERPEFHEQPRPSLQQSLQAMLRNRPFLFAVGIYLLTWLTVDLLLLILPFFLKYWLGLEAQQEAILGTVFVVAALALPLWMWACHRWSKRHAYVAGVGFLALVMIVLTLMQPGTPLPAILLLAALAGIGVAAAHVVPWSIIPDAVEWDELATGQRHEGAFYSLITLASKVAASLALPGAMLVLDWGGYVANAEVQGPRVLLAIRALAGAVPALLLIGGMVFAYLYPLSREEHLAVRKELALRRAGTAAGAPTGAKA